MRLRSIVIGRLLGLDRPVTPVRVDRDLEIAMADGTVLLADRWHPVSAAEERAPILLARLPYGRGGIFGIVFRALAEQGFQVVAVSTRGTFGSGGDWVPFRDEQADGADVLTWLADQPWFVDRRRDHRRQLLRPDPVGDRRGPASVAQGDDPRHHEQLVPRPALPRRDVRPRDRPQLDPRRRAPGGRAARARADWRTEARRRPGGRHRSARRRRPRGRRPPGRLLPGLARARRRRATRGGTRSTSGRPSPPHRRRAWWPAGTTSSSPTSSPTTDGSAPPGTAPACSSAPGGTATATGAGALARETLDWADVHLRGRPSKRSTDVRVFVMGADEWRRPRRVAAARPRRRRSTSTAGFASAPTNPTSAEPDRFRYDPADPTPSLGGASLSSRAGPKDNEPARVPVRRAHLHDRPLDQDVTAIGDVIADLYVRSSLEHTDFFVRLCDVEPGGKSINISDGVLRLPSEAAERSPDGITRIRIPMFATAVTFRRGHRIRLQVSSGAHPVHARNLGERRTDRTRHHLPGRRPGGPPRSGAPVARHPPDLRTTCLRWPPELARWRSAR